MNCGRSDSRAICEVVMKFAFRNMCIPLFSPIDSSRNGYRVENGDHPALSAPGELNFASVLAVAVFVGCAIGFELIGDEESESPVDVL